MATISTGKYRKKGDYISLVFMYYKNSAYPSRAFGKPTRDRDAINVQRFEGEYEQKDEKFKIRRESNRSRFSNPLPAHTAMCNDI